jgi:hypothetical protein
LKTIKRKGIKIMSYEGYVQLLCEKGHYRTCDCSEIDKPTVCPSCKSKWIWQNNVDTTNGSYDVDSEGGEDTSVRIDGYVELEANEPIITHTCSCGNVHMSKKATYKIPDGVGHKE